MLLERHPALVLNADFRPLSTYPLSTIPADRAVKAVYEGTHVVVAEYDTVIRSPSTTMRLPSVLALKQYRKMPRRVPFTRFNVFLRDDFTCQYCGNEFEARDLTFDHLIPRSKGGTTEWENILAACCECNSKKADGDLTPIRMPRAPEQEELARIRARYPQNYLHETWIDYLYWQAEMEE
jgi:5-methylcytosine-specific restriction endonuclease McrA